MWDVIFIYQCHNIKCSPTHSSNSTESETAFACPATSDDKEMDSSGSRNPKYQVIDRVQKSKWPRFAREVLGLTNAEMDNIQNNYKDNVEEQKYQMLLLWDKKSRENTDERLRHLTYEFTGPNARYCKVMFDYTVENHDELPLQKGEVIVLADKNSGDEGWWKGEKMDANGKKIKGVFPDNFVVELSPEEAKEHEKQLQAKSEPDTSKAHDSTRKISGVTKHSGIGSSIGRKLSATKTFLKNLFVAAEAKDTTKEAHPSTVITKPKEQKWMKTNFAYTAKNSDELSLEIGDIVEFVEEVEEGWAEGICKGKKGVFPTNFGEIIPENSESKERRDDGLEKREEKPTKEESLPNDGALAMSSQKKAKSAPDTPKDVRYCKVMFDYTVEHDDELPLQKGEVIVLADKESGDDGWWKGEKMDANGRKIKGVFPDVFVAELSREEAREHEKQLQAKSGSDTSKGHDVLSNISGVTKDSGIGSSIGSKLSAANQSQKSRISRKMTTVLGSLPDISVEEPSFLKRKRFQNPEFKPDVLKSQKQEMKLLGLGSEFREHRDNKIARWLQGVEMDLDEDITGSTSAVGRLIMSDKNLGVDIDLGENIPEGIHTAVDKLTMGGFNPLPETLEIFSNCLQVINLQVHDLDLSNNVVLKEDEISHIGTIVRHSNVSSLLLQDCELDFELMLKLQKSIGDTKLTNLDVSKANDSQKSPTKLGSDCAAVLGNIVSNCRIQTLALRNRGLRQEDVSRLRQALADAKLFEIDVGGNDSLGPDGIAELAGLVHKAEVEKLILRNCGLYSTNLWKLEESIGDTKLTTIDVSENEIETDGMAYLGHIAKHCMVRNLLLRDCPLTPGHMTALQQSLEGYMLMKLDISKKKAPALALSSLESNSTEASDDTGYTEEEVQSEVIPESPKGYSEEEDQSEVIPESPKETPESRTAECSRDTKQETLPSFQPEQLIMNLLPNVKERIKMDNWEIKNEGKKLLEDEMRKRMLLHLEISFGSGRTRISCHGCREHAGKQTGTAKKVTWADARSTTPIKEQHAKERGTNILEEAAEENLEKVKLELEGTPTEREGTQAPDDAEENKKAPTDPASMLPATPAQLQSIQVGNQAALDWPEGQGAVGGRPASTDPATKLPSNPGQLPCSIQGRNQAAVDWQEERGAVGARPDLFLHHKRKDNYEETPPAKEMNLEAKGTSVERPETMISPRVPEGESNSKDTTRDSDAVKQVVGTVGWSPQRTAQRKYIDKEGGEINICGCKIAFPCDSVKEEKEIQVSICPDVEEDLDISGFNYDTIAVTPTFEFKPSVKFEKPVTVEMATCLRAIGDNKIPVVVLSKKLSKPWEVLAQAFVGNQGVIQFETLHFCKLQTIVNKLYAYFFGWSLTNELYINKHTTAIASVFTKKFQNQLVEDKLQKKGYVTLPVASEELIVKVGDVVEFWMECKKPTQMSITPSNAILAITEDNLEKEKNQEHFEMDPSLDEQQGKVRFCYHVKSTHEKEKRLPFRLSWPILETPSAGHKVQHDGVHDLKKVTNVQHDGVNVQVTIDNRDTANYMAKSGGKIDAKAENTTIMASQRQQSADDIPDTSRGNVDTS